MIVADRSTLAAAGRCRAFATATRASSTVRSIGCACAARRSSRQRRPRDDALPALALARAEAVPLAAGDRAASPRAVGRGADRARRPRRGRAPALRTRASRRPDRRGRCSRAAGCGSPRAAPTRRRRAARVRPAGAGHRHRQPGVVPWRSQLAHALLEPARSPRRAAWPPRARGRAPLRRPARDRHRAAGRGRRPRAASDEIQLLREAVATPRRRRAAGPRPRTCRARRRAAARGARREARDPLRLAVDLAHRCGAAALEERALAELRAAGARPRRRLVAGAGALTPERAPDRRPRRRRPAEPRDRRGPGRHAGHRRVPPAQRLPQARDRVPGRARCGAGLGSQLANVNCAGWGKWVSAGGW